ncbi:MAG: hypothetical protein ACR2JM_10925, partial [Mycobacterium sp.]
MPMSRRAYRTPALVLLIAVIAAAVYLPKLATVGVLDHDDVISIIAATCNQGRYEQYIPSGQWVPASEWQQYWQMGRFDCFSLIGHDLAHYDIHPPLYFWLLHIWLC